MAPPPSSALWTAAFLGYSVVVAAAGVGLLYWALRDASQRGSHWPAAWAAVVVLAAPVAVPTYLLVRSRLGSRTDPPSRAERLGASLGMGVLAVFIAETLVGPPDPYSQLLFVVPATVVVVPAVYWALFGRRPRATKWDARIGVAPRVEGHDR